MNPEVRSELAPSGVLRAGIDLANFLLVTGRGPEGEPRGVAPGMAAGIAERIGVDIACVPFATPSELADAGGGGDDVRDIGLIGAEPARRDRLVIARVSKLLRQAPGSLRRRKVVQGRERMDEPDSMRGWTREPRHRKWAMAGRGRERVQKVPRDARCG